jgi:hypothetical protein
MNSDSASESKGVKRRRSGIPTACDYCRRLHEKCDGNHPCQRCTRRNKTCLFTEVSGPAPKKQKKADKKPVAVAAAALVKETEALKTIPKLKETARYRYEASNLVQVTLISSLPDAPKLAKYQGIYFKISHLVMHKFLRLGSINATKDFVHFCFFTLAIIDSSFRSPRLLLKVQCLADQWV